MEQSVDSANDKYTVDGDLYLIKTISRYPILWDRKNFDSDQRNEVWQNLSKKLDLKLEWMKKRWSYLREQYVRHLKQVNNLESDKPLKKNYKYFTEMSFLANHIQIRNGNYQDVISHITNGEKIDSIEFTDQIEDNDEEADKDHGVEGECIDFVITENELEAYNDDDDENMFIELSDEDVETILQPTDDVPSVKTSAGLVTQTPVSNSRPISNNPTKQTKTATVTYEDSLELQSEQRLPLNGAENESYQKITKTTESRCEDVIFGELVTSMLKKMDSPSRKRAKKEILNILLS
ncbi:uncharacterized protein LOC119068751 [Bradysia coprophila]|uniref:uncharacterized protein LOC119068751 n=1 Tax=Bradysia coprophila TaxID=38358 RepID=UPI00187DBD9A|nr:uncharacterized protein LOC119068751 [Bradysia coprophila]